MQWGLITSDSVLLVVTRINDMRLVRDDVANKQLFLQRSPAFLCRFTTVQVSPLQPHNHTQRDLIVILGLPAEIISNLTPLFTVTHSNIYNYHYVYLVNHTG